MISSTFPLDRSRIAQRTEVSGQRILNTASDEDLALYLTEEEHRQLDDILRNISKRLSKGRRVLGLAEEQYEPGTIVRIDVDEAGADRNFREGQLLYVREFWNAGMSGNDEYQVDTYDGTMVEYSIPAMYVSRASEAEIRRADEKLAEIGFRRVGAEVDFIEG